MEKDKRKEATKKLGEMQSCFDEQMKKLMDRVKDMNQLKIAQSYKIAKAAKEALVLKNEIKHESS